MSSNAPEEPSSVIRHPSSVVRGLLIASLLRLPALAVSRDAPTAPDAGGASRMGRYNVAVFPFRCFGAALGSGDLVAWTLEHRTCKDVFDCRCWTQDQIRWAGAGRAAEAAAGLVRRFRNASPRCRFPLYGREGPAGCEIKPLTQRFNRFLGGAVD